MFRRFGFCFCLAVHMRLARLVLVLVVAYFCGDVLTPATPRDAPQSFPLSPGTYWAYQGLVRSELEDSSVGKVTEVTWKMSVVRRVERDGLLVAIVNGFPSDLNWSEGSAKPTLSLLIESQDASLYLISTADDPSLTEQVDNPQYALGDLLREDERILQLPLRAGARFGCDEGAENREDGEYCWVVGSPHPAALAGVKGVVAGNRVSYEVDYHTNPDDSEIEFVPGIGITSYSYHHHGSIAETELHLVEFHTPN